MDQPIPPKAFEAHQFCEASKQPIPRSPSLPCALTRRAPTARSWTGWNPTGRPRRSWSRCRTAPSWADQRARCSGLSASPPSPPSPPRTARPRASCSGPPASPPSPPRTRSPRGQRTRGIPDPIRPDATRRGDSNTQVEVELRPEPGWYPESESVLGVEFEFHGEVGLWVCMRFLG